MNVFACTLKGQKLWSLRLGPNSMEGTGPCTIQALPREEEEETMDYSQLQELGFSSGRHRAAQSSPKPTRSWWPLGLQGGIASPSSNTAERGILERHSPAENGRCGRLRPPAWAQRLLFPECGTATDSALETVGCLQGASGQVVLCLAAPMEVGGPGAYLHLLLCV